MENKQLHILGRGSKIKQYSKDRTAENPNVDFTGFHFVDYTNLQSKIGDVFEYRGTYLRLDVIYPDGDYRMSIEYRQSIPAGYKSICKFTPLNGDESWDGLPIIQTWSKYTDVTLYICDVTVLYNRDNKLNDILQ